MPVLYRTPTDQRKNGCPRRKGIWTTNGATPVKTPKGQAELAQPDDSPKSQKSTNHFNVKIEFLREINATHNTMKKINNKINKQTNQLH
ncbi:hypothetical protein HT136_19620 [Novosphingobium profundi]|uniref:hypothetical protein n=1 Tax=Novosphingobium profundi TaxID=1774954 RepID=UPI001BDA4BF3|nr:hypothetical protein [Novosphingobium profundi]MBT0670581.1 hypothetical protein [Novosphingobium profundi]